jgi:hypothetical protein
MTVQAPQWAVDAAEIYVQRILKRSLHVMEVVRKSKKQPEPKTWSKQIFLCLKSDPRVVFDPMNQTFNNAMPGNNPTNSARPLPTQQIMTAHDKSLIHTNATTHTAEQLDQNSNLKLTDHRSMPDQQHDVVEMECLPKLSQTTYAAQTFDDDEKICNANSLSLETHQSVPSSFFAMVGSALIDMVTPSSSADSLLFNSERHSNRNQIFSQVIRQAFYSQSYEITTSQTASLGKRVIGDSSTVVEFEEHALLGRLNLKSNAVDSQSANVFLNTHQPFCIAAIGVQGSGKSHTLACILESCLLPIDVPTEFPLIRLHRPMAALVFHYEQNQNSICEATGLLKPSIIFRSMQAANTFTSSEAMPAFCLRPENLIILVSPTFYRQRRAFYGDLCTVKPLLLRWSSLTADHIKKLMRVRDDDSQLYVASMLNLLRLYQRKGVVPDFQGFFREVRQLWMSHR